MSADRTDEQLESAYFSVEDGLRLHYRDYPGDTSRPPILCLPGLTRNARDFAAVAERLSPQFRVLCLDFRGRGGSDFDPQPKRYLPPVYARDSIALLDHVGVDKAIIIGTSLGGIVAMIIAAMAPDRIVATILNDVGPELSEVGLERIRDYVGSGKVFSSWAEAAQAVADNQSRLPAAWGDEQWERMARRVCRVSGEGAIRFDYDPAIAEPFRHSTGKSDADMWPLFDALAEKPMLVVRGELSELFTADGLRQLGERSPKVRTVTVVGAGHAPELDEPEAVAAIDSFLGEVVG